MRTAHEALGAYPGITGAASRRLLRAAARRAWPCVAAWLLAADAAAQEPAAVRLWAAQTGTNHVELAWDSVPDATEYRIHLGDPNSPGSFLQQPASRTGGRVRRGRVNGIHRAVHGIRLVAVDAGGRVLYQGEFNRVVPATAFPPATAPAALTAEATGTSEITLTWDPVPGATAYFIGRAVGGSGFTLFCPLCSTEGRYVDRTALAGLPHTYILSAIFPSGAVSTRVRSATVTPGGAQVAAAPASGNPGAWTPTGTPPGSTTTPTPTTPPGTPAGALTTSPPATQPVTDSVPPLVNPQIPATMPDTAPPTIGPLPSGADALATPPADTGTCVGARADPTTADTLERIDPRDARIDLRNDPNPDASLDSWAAVTTTNLGSADYRQGKCLNPGATGYPDLWDPIAAASGMTSAERVAAWKEIGIIALEYRHILGRQPTPEETRRDVAALKAGTTWYQLWRQLAHSSERDARFGYWAPAPIPDSLEAQRAFGLRVPPWTAQQCYGALGPKCGGLPDAINALNDRVYKAWFGAFRMPDNTEFAYIEMGVAVGSVLHDNACLADKGGLNCNGLGAGDFIKLGGLWAAELEWNKAAWNVADQRTWRARFGPYPTNLAFRDRYWYDDLRPVQTRPAMMAPAISVLSWPGLTVTYTGGETRQSRALMAPAGTTLDATDAAYCASGRFASTNSLLGKAPWGTCAEGPPVSTTHAASPPTTATPTTGTPTTGTPTTGTTTPAACTLEYRRADNMWAAMGRPDGFLGVESITLAAGSSKIFITDWKYEKQPNDGTTYYGSHLRVATNRSSRPIRLQVIEMAGTLMYHVRLDPGVTKQFQADLREVYCEP